jgi:hypothetical protein
MLSHNQLHETSQTNDKIIGVVMPFVFILKEYAHPSPCKVPLVLGKFFNVTLQQPSQNRILNLAQSNG